MEAYEVKFKVWAESQEEADLLSDAFRSFVNELGSIGIAVTASKAKEAIPKWKDNFLVKSKVLDFFKVK